MPLESFNNTTYIKHLFLLSALFRVFSRLFGAFFFLGTLWCRYALVTFSTYLAEILEMASRNEPEVLKRRFCSLNASVFKNCSFERFNLFASTYFLDSCSYTFTKLGPAERNQQQSLMLQSHQIHNCFLHCLSFGEDIQMWMSKATSAHLNTVFQKLIVIMGVLFL